MKKNTVENRCYERMLDLIRGMFDAALKTNEYLKFAVITGCLRIVKESIFAGTYLFRTPQGSEQILAKTAFQCACARRVSPLNSSFCAKSRAKTSRMQRF